MFNQYFCINEERITNMRCGWTKLGPLLLLQCNDKILTLLLCHLPMVMICWPCYKKSELSGMTFAKTESQLTMNALWSQFQSFWEKRNRDDDGPFSRFPALCANSRKFSLALAGRWDLWSCGALMCTCHFQSDQTFWHGSLYTYIWLDIYDCI